MHAGRWAFNRMLEAVRAGRPASLETANELTKATRSHPEQKRIHRSIFKNAMMDVVAAVRGERTKAATARRPHGTIQFRSLRRTLTETVRLDAAQFAADDPSGQRRPKDAGPVMCIEMPEEDHASAERPANRITAQVRFGGRMQPLPPVIIRDRRWLIERLVSERYLRHEAKLHWNRVVVFTSNHPHRTSD